MLVVERHLPDGFDTDAYQASLDDLIAQAGRLDAEARRRTLDMLADLRARIVVAASEVPAGSVAAYRDAMDKVDAAIGSFVSRYATDVADLQRRGFDVGAQIAQQPLINGGLAIAVAAIPDELVDIAQGFSADLIQGLGQDLRRRINAELVSVAAGTSTPADALTAIGRNLRSANHFRTIGSRAQAIVTTEVGRVISVASQATLAKIAEQVPELRKRWVHSGVGEPRPEHLEAAARYAPDGTVGPIPVADAYQVAGFEAQYPRAGNLPAAQTVFCRCQSVPWVPDLPAHVEPDDGRSDRFDAQPEAPAGDTWADFGVKLPRARERRRVLDDALTILMRSPSAGVYRRALHSLNGAVKFSVLSTSRNMRILGRVRTRMNMVDRRVTDRDMFIELGRDFDQTAMQTWSQAEYQEYVRLRAERVSLPPAEQLEFDIKARMKAWEKANPKPTRRLATADELAETIAHELGHVIEYIGGTVSRTGRGPVTELLASDGTMDIIRRRYRAGDESLWYAVDSPQEAFAELFGWFTNGRLEGSSWDAMTAAEWRAAYPELAEWVSTNVLGVA